MLLSKPESLCGVAFSATPFGLSRSVHKQESGSMMDTILIGTALAFFALCFAYTRACDRL
jgi:hypothetical protein